MCQATCGPARIGCSKCGAGFYENEPHKCLVFVPFEQWLSELKERASQLCTAAPGSIWEHAHRCTQDIASWPEWQLRYVWAEEYRYSVKEGVD